jgi:hypothetical protein
MLGNAVSARPLAQEQRHCDSRLAMPVAVQGWRRSVVVRERDA